MFHTPIPQDNDDLKATLTHASDMLRELRTGLLTPKNYYELYMKVRHVGRNAVDRSDSIVFSSQPACRMIYTA